MFGFVRNIPIYRRLFFAFTITTIITGIALIVVGSFNLNSLSIRDQAVRASFDAQNQASQQQINLQRMNALLQTRHNQIFASLSAVVQDPSLSASGALVNSDILARESNFEQSVLNYQNNFEVATSSNMSIIRNVLMSDDPTSHIISNQQQALENVIQVQWPEYKKLQDQELAQLQQLQADQENHVILTPAQLNQAYEDAYSTLYDANNSFTNLRNSWQLVLDSAVSMGKTVTAVGPSQTNPVLFATALALLSSVLLVIIVGFVVNRTITQPLRQLALLTRRISKGETNARAELKGNDEIFIVANSMNTMMDSIVRLIQEAQNQRDNLQAQVEKLVSEVSDVGEGDLRIQAEVTSDALGVLADSFNYMVEELGSLIVHVKMVAQEVRNSTTATFDQMGYLVKTSDMQIYQIANAVTEIGNMAASSRLVAEQAQNLYSRSNQTRATAQLGRRAVRQTAEGMQRISDNVQTTATKVQTLGERSQEINQVVEVIGAIAHQTNRLALDAAIQAAMAGENGKGFAAVAADIRRLAERAKEQTSIITRIVRDVVEEIDTAAVAMQETKNETSTVVKFSQEAGISLESIFNSIEQQAQEIETISTMAAQQLQSSGAVAQIMHTVSNSTQQSGNSTREVAISMERMARLAERLLSSVEAFKLREDTNYYPASTNALNPAGFEPEDQMTVSSVFRIVTASAQPLGNDRYSNKPVPAGANSYSIQNQSTAPIPMKQQESRPQWPQNGSSSTNGNGNGNGAPTRTPRFPQSDSY